jgi:hypothetical protein
MDRNRYKKWVCSALGTVVGGILSTGFIYILTVIGFSFYDRTGLDNELKKRLGDATFDDLMSPI